MINIFIRDLFCLFVSKNKNQQLFDSYLKGSHLVGKVRSVRFLTPDAAIMHVVDGTIMAGQMNIEPDRNPVQTLVAMKGSKGKWQLAHFKTREVSILEDPSNLRR